MQAHIKIIASLILALFTTACIGNSGFTHVRTESYAAYTRGDSLLAANGAPIKVVVLTEKDKQNIGNSIASSLEQYGPKWFVARYSADNTIKNNHGYELRWAYNTPENGNEDRLCNADYANSITTSEQTTGVVLAAFCRDSTFLSSIRARILEGQDSDSFRKTIGLMGRKLMPVRNPDRVENCRNLEDCL